MLSSSALAAMILAHVVPSTCASEPAKVTDPLVKAHHIRFGNEAQYRTAIEMAVSQRDLTMVAPMLYTMRFRRDDQGGITRALARITGKNYGGDWFRWSQYLQKEDIPTIDEFDEFLFNHLRVIDPDFSRFIYPGVSHRVRLQEVLWGGVPAVDGIPPLDHPPMVEADRATYLSDDERVFGIQIGDDTRAYPYRFMDWHEMLNDTIGGQPVSLAYCTLCGSGILFDTSHADGHYRFGSSGLLYRSNKLMFDHATYSLWNQFTGTPVIGPLTNDDVRLVQLPLVSTTWRQWREAHPTTQVMNGETGHQRDYSPGAAYSDYFNSPDLMFPARTDDRKLRQKARVFAIRISGAEKAWPLRNFRKGKVINDSLGVLNVVLIGDEASREVRAYRRGELTFNKLKGTLRKVEAGGLTWDVTEKELTSSDGQRLSRLPGHLAFWFAWHNFADGESLAR
ncbi:MAG: DUF3179 domain-containing protein [Pseudomonadota bacterium]